MTPTECAQALATPVYQLGGAFMLDPQTMQAGKDLGLTAWSTYYCGRAGVLDSSVEVAIAALAFFPPHMIREAWERGSQVMPPAEAGRHYGEFCAEWGRRNLADADPRAVELLERVVDGAQPIGLPLFVAWRAQPRPADPPGRLALLLHIMREHRGGVHAAACTAVGLEPLQAFLAGPTASVASLFGWPEPYPDPAPWQAQHEAAQELAKAGAGMPYAVLDPAERAELVGLLTAIESAPLWG